MSVKLSKVYFQGHEKDVSKYLPYLPIRLRDDKIQLGGKSYPYEDVTKFVHRDNTFVPLICAGNVKEGEKVLDLYPFLNIGLTEVLLTIEPNRTKFEHTLIAIFCSEKLFPTIEDALDYMNDETKLEEAIGQSIRSSSIRCDFHVIKKIVTLLNIAHDAKPKFYFEQMFDLMQIAYTYCLPWVEDKEHPTKVEYSISPRAEENLSMEEVMKFIGSSIHNHAERFGAVEYTTKEGKKRRITDGRGLSVFVFLSFLTRTYGMYADLNKKKKEAGILKDGALETIDKRLLSCIGDDAIGKYFLFGKVPPDEIKEDAEEALGAVRYTVFDSRITCEGDEGETTTRGMMDNKVMFEYASGYKGGDYASFSYNDCFYTSYDETYVCAITSVLAQENYEMLKKGLEVYIYEAINKHPEILLSFAESNADIIWDKCKKQLSEKYEEENGIPSKEEIAKKEKQERELVEENDALKKKIAELSMQLETKKRQVDDQEEEINALRSTQESFYSEEDFEEDVSEASFEEMVEFLKDYRITMVGGHFDTENRLSSMGLTDVIYIRSEQEAQGSVWQTDFICICATFVSHKIVHAVESKFQDKRADTMYFNGTNADKLVRALYDFVQKWMAK